MKKIVTVAIVAGFMGLAGMSAAFADGEHVAPIKELITSKLKTAMTSPIVVDAIKAQNQKNAGLSQADIDMLDKKWRAEVDAAAKPMISEMQANDLSKYLRDLKEGSQGTYTEIFVMDNKGLNVGMSDVTSDYWQGDEGKFKKSFGMGKDAVFVDEVEQDESTQTLQSQASFTIVDPATGEAIGAVTFGINVDGL